MNITSQDISGILEEHKKWLTSQEGGKRADLREADLRGADLRGADLRGADLRDVDLRGADLRGADLSCVDLSCVDLHGADLYGATLYRAIIYRSEVAKLSKVAIVGPVGKSDRQVLGVIAKADGVHKKPWLLLICGCFSGDEKQYRAQVDKIYKRGSAHHKQCLAALVAIKAISKTWGVK